MQFSKFGEKFIQNSPILQLMDDLGNALNSDTPINMLGGGNPANIPEVSAAYHAVYQQIATNGTAIESMSNYASPQGDTKFIKVLVEFFNRHYGWGLTSDHIVLTNGSQNAFFYLFNLFAGNFVMAVINPFCCLCRLNMSAMLMYKLRVLILCRYPQSSKKPHTKVVKDFLNIKWILMLLKI